MEFRLLNGEEVLSDGLAEASTVAEAKHLVAAALKVLASQVVLLHEGVLQTDDALPDCTIQVYIQEIKVSKEEFLQKVQKTSADCKQLPRLTVRAHLTALPEDFGSLLPRLTFLCLTNNHISHCPSSIGELDKLKQLFLEGNQLNDLPASVAKLQDLEELKLDRNQFQHIPEEVFTLVKLKELSISSNQLKEVPELIGQLQSLERLLLSQNQLSVVPSLAFLNSLTELVLSQNAILSLPDIWNLPHLKHLDISYNKLAHLPPLSTVMAPSLKVLLVNNNRLSCLPDGIGRLRQLEDLNLNENVLQSLPQSFEQLEALQNVWLDKAQMAILPTSSRSLLRVAATLYTSLEGEVKAAPEKEKGRSKKESSRTLKADRVFAIFQSFDINGDGVIDKEELRQVLQSIRCIGSVITDDMIDLALAQMDRNLDGMINFEEFLSWLYSTKPSTEKQLVRRAVGILEHEGAEGSSTGHSVEKVGPSPPALTRVSSRALAERAQLAIKALHEEDLLALPWKDTRISGLLEVLSLLLAGMVPGTGLESSGPLAGADVLMTNPRYFVAACESVLSWIDEGKLPEENVESARAVKDGIGLDVTVVREASSTAACLCEWALAIFAYFDAVENWEP